MARLHDFIIGDGLKERRLELAQMLCIVIWIKKYTGVITILSQQEFLSEPVDLRISVS